MQQHDRFDCTETELDMASTLYVYRSGITHWLGNNVHFGGVFKIKLSK